MAKRICAMAVSLVGTLVSTGAFAADHGDTPTINGVSRHDVNLTDLYVFYAGDSNQRIVFATEYNDTIPKTATKVQSAPDLTLDLYIDRHSGADMSIQKDTTIYGGDIPDPAGISADVDFHVTFAADGTPTMTASGLTGGASLSDCAAFFGPRSDPFIRGPRVGRNVLAWVLDCPKGVVVQDAPDGKILAWATSNAPGETHQIADRAGRALRSMFKENSVFNFYANPASDFTIVGNAHPDVTICDTTGPAAYPNCRSLFDDVVHIVADPRLLVNNFPNITTPWAAPLATFPYLAPPQAPMATAGYFINVNGGSTDPGTGDSFPDTANDSDMDWDDWNSANQ
jgi:hypothetical protein